MLHKEIMSSEIVGTGTYGIVYRPPIACNKKFKHKDIVGKVFSDKEDYIDEVNINKKVKAINSKNLFSIPLYQNCPENLEIIYADGGKDLYDYMSDESNLHFHHIFKNMIYLLQGIKMLLKNNYVHQDIKLENIVFNGVKLYLIDFGLMVKQNEIYKNDGFLKYTYLAYPPEYKRHYYGTKFIPYFIKNLNRSFTFIKKIYPNYF
jgi:serine/threonine protein kinase